MLPIVKDKPFTPSRRVSSVYVAPCRKPSRNCPEGNHTHNFGSPNGSGWLERKASGYLVYHTPWTAKYRLYKPPSEPKPRIETADETLTRLRKVKADARYAEDAGTAATDGMKVESTNGHWALCVPGDGNGKSCVFSEALKGSYQTCVIIDPEFHLILKRASITAGEFDQVSLQYADGELTVTSAESTPIGTGGYVLASFEETTSCLDPGEWKVVLDWRYLEPVFGSWPIRIKIKDDGTLVILEPLTQEWQFVLATLRAR